LPAGGRRGVAALSVLCAGSLLMTACGGGKHEASGTSAPTSTSSTSSTTRPVHKHKHKRRPAVAKVAAVCPLNGLTPRDGRVPQRPAIAVKVENLPQARPQWGLDSADIVFEEPVEGGITRFIAVYQCHTAARIEPVRSARLVDAQILQPMGRILFAYSGAIQAVIDEVDSSTSLLDDVGADRAGGAYWRDPTRYAPHNLVTSTSALYNAAHTFGYKPGQPKPIFTYGKMVPGGTPAGIINLHFPLDVTTWTWHPKAGVYYRSYSDTGRAMQGDNVQVSASNVVVMIVHEYPTQYVEDADGSLENELVLTGSGPAWVFRNGVQFFGKWERPDLSQPAVFVEPNGTKITLSPGNTWEELVPQGEVVSVLP